ncbi:SMI1/KNR4 family protein [Enterococcus sp. LJL51]|uniref:SMI1/KNR4 family protein n=1 Tax=Enterococcus sp. LJL51 TaxID=3416656 RepID=UPI003CF579DD
MDVSDRLVPGILPFGRDPGGNMICFDYRSGDNQIVVFGDYEVAGGGELERAISPICNTFTNLFE